MGYKYRLLLPVILFILLHTSCVSEHNIEGTDQQDGIISIRLAAVNRDIDYFEDRVSEIRVLIFDPLTGYCRYNELLSFKNNNLQNDSHPIKVEPGSYDFLFIANESAITGFSNKIGAVQNYLDLDALYFRSLPFDKNFKPDAASNTGKFLMSAFYEDIAVVPGTTITAPQNIPVSLVRAFARIEIVIKNEEGRTDKQIKKIILSNVPAKFTHPANGRVYSASEVHSEINYPVNFPVSDYSGAVHNANRVGRLFLYIPEYLLSAADARSPVSMTLSGIGFASRTIDLTTPSALNAAIKAMPININTASISEKSIVRNVNYKVTANLTRTDLKTTLKVMPWEYVTSNMDFDTPAFDFKIEKNGVVIGNGIANKDISLQTGESVKVTFTLNAPAGSKWKATLTNGFDFKFTEATLSKAHGSIGSYTFEIVPAHAWNGSMKYSEFYISVNGRELELLAEGLSGVNSRYRFRQIE